MKMMFSTSVAVAGLMFTALPGPLAAAVDDQGTSATGFSAREFQLNTFEYNAQEAASLAVSPDGTILAAWGSRRQEEGTFGIFARLVAPNGQPVGGELHLNQYLANNQAAPAVAFDDHGVAWVVWNSFGQDGDQGSIILRRFSTVDGVFQPLGDEMIVNTTRTGDQTQATVAAGAQGALVAWTDVTADGERQFVAARAFNRDGTAVDDAASTVIADVEREHAWLPCIAAQPDGAFVVAWASRTVGGGPAGLFGCRVDREGSIMGERFAIAPPQERFDVEPSIAADARGNFVVTWMGSSDNGRYDVYARRFAHDASPRSDAERVMTADDGWRSGAAIAVAADGRYIIAANLEGEAATQSTNGRAPSVASSIMAQRFDADGQAIGSALRINRHDAGRQLLNIASNAQRMVWTADNRIACVWQGDTGSDGSGIALTTLSPVDVASVIHASSGDGVALAVADDLHAQMSGENFGAEAPPIFDPNFVPEPPDFPANPGQDFGFIGFQNTGWTPPDPDLAVGPNHVVVVVNGGIRAYTKDGTLVFEDDISGSDGFWGEVGATHFVFDPVAVYDTLSGRYIVVTTEHGDPNRSIEIINIAVSQTSDPLDGWHKYRFNFESVGNFIDFPNLGVGPDAIYVTCDYFSDPRGNWIHIFDKQRLMNGQSVTPKVLQTSGGFRSLGAITSYDAEQPAQYFATAYSGSDTAIAIDAVRDPNGTPTRVTFNLTVPFHAEPPPAAQLGSSNTVATVGKRIKHGVLRNGHLWLVHTVGDGGTARLRWYQVDMRGWPTSGNNPQLVQTGTQNLGAGVHNWFGDIHVDAAGNAAVAFNQSSSSEYVSVQRTFRLNTDSPGTLRTPVMQQTSNSPETGSRWGDYSGIEQDPVEPSVYWNHHEYRTSSWRTWVGKFDIVANLPGLAFDYPDGRPEIVDSNGGTTFTVEVLPGANAPQPGTGLLWVKLNGTYTSFPMKEGNANVYTAMFPPTPCGNVVEYYVSAETAGSQQINDPIDAPTTFFTAQSYADVEVAFEDDFETDNGWTVVNENLTDGAWERAIPAGDGSRGDPTSDFDGSGHCYVTDNAIGNSDVDGGPTRLISPIFDLSSSGSATVSFAAWFSNDDDDEDRLTVEISNNGGSTWVLVEQLGNTSGWLQRAFDVQDFVTQTTQVRLRFSVADNPNNSVTEAALDAIEISSVGCGSGTEVVDFTFARGDLVSGGLAELLSSDDLFLRGKSVFGFISSEPNLVELIVGAETQVSSPSTIDLVIEGRLNNPNGNVRVRLRNWSTSQLQQVHQYTLGTTETTENINGIAAANRVRSSDGRIEVSIKQVVIATFSVSGFQTYFDRVGVDVN
ncbi:MAG: choice-of-anchor J domain-containing protein [Phycisphaerales bacterium]